MVGGEFAGDANSCPQTIEHLNFFTFRRTFSYLRKHFVPSSVSQIYQSLSDNFNGFVAYTLTSLQIVEAVAVAQSQLKTFRIKSKQSDLVIIQKISIRLRYNQTFFDSPNMQLDVHSYTEGVKLQIIAD